jgi:hypothetical protein
MGGGDPIAFCSYFVAMCIFARFWASDKSYIGVKVPDALRCLLLIFSFEEIRISIFCVLSQLCLYIMLFLFIASKVLPSEVIGNITSEPNTLLSWLILIHVVTAAISKIESSICEWRFRQHR